MRLILAFSSFFRLLFGAKLHPRAADYLPETATPALPATSEVREDSAGPQPARNQPDVTPSAKPTVAQNHRDGALAFLALLQREGRLIDFLQESIDDYDDADIGAAARDIHRGCKKAISDHITLEAVMPGDEEQSITVAAGFDPGEIRLVGEIAGEPPFSGVLRHHGWRATKAELPVLSENVDRRVIAPAEVEVG